MADALTAPIEVPALLVVLVVLALVLLVAVIWSIRRHRSPKLDIDCDAPIDELMPSMSGLSQGVVYRGNHVELFENGAFFEAMFEEIAAATRTVHFETFLWKDGQLGRRLVDALIERRRAGVTVRVLVDGDGGKNMGDDVERRLTEAGCRFAWHHPPRWRHIGVYNERDHRKLVVLDGRVALLGGHCIVDQWLGDAEDASRVRDLGVRLRGPGVHGVQSAFCENWVEDTGELPVGDGTFPALAAAGEVEVHVASLKPEGSAPAVKVLHHLAVCVARRRIFIQNPYFLPDDEAIEALGAAVARGVDVRVMVPSATASDMPIVQHAAHHNFERLLRLGVRIFEFQTCLLHQKVVTVDGAWCAIGSSNFDDRSFETNDEITLGVRNPGLARRLEEIFAADARQCVELQLSSWQRRSLRHRLLDRAFYSANELL